MSGIWGRNLEISIFGESHGRAIGVTIHGLAPGIKLDLESIQGELERRAPGGSEFSSPRQESDDFEILSGYFKGRTTGGPLTALLWNRDTRSRDYENLRTKLRPGHGDYSGHVKYRGSQDFRGGGHFSGRLTAPLVFAGAIAKQLLESRSILVGAHIKSIMDIKDDDFDPLEIPGESIRRLRDMDFPVLNGHQGRRMQERIRQAREEQDSVGGIVQCAITNLPPGIGDPFFHSLESSLAQMMFSIPGVKGIEFGSGFNISRLRGSQVKDEYALEDGRIVTLANHNGGILGGISTGMPILFNTAIKPTSSIGQEQRTVDINRMEETTLTIEGRHDPCILPRAVPVIEAGAALVILDLIMEGEGKDGWAGSVEDGD